MDETTAAPTATPAPTATSDGAVHDPTADLVRLGAVHALVVLVPVLVVAVLVLPPLLGVVLAVAVAAAATVWRCRHIDDRIARALGAERVVPGARPRFENLVESMGMAVGVTPPQVHAIADDARNAVAWGSGTGPGSIAVTTGLLDAADRIALEAVVAHLLTHLRDGVVEGPTVAAALFEPLASGPLAGPMARLAHAEADDRRVVLADIEGARATRYPPGMVAALDVLAGGSTTVARTPRALQPLWIAAPIEVAPAAGDDRDPFAVHPPLADRADLLREL